MTIRCRPTSKKTFFLYGGTRCNLSTACFAFSYLTLIPALLQPMTAHAEDDTLTVGKACPVYADSHEKTQVGTLAFSQPWYHSGRTDARYIPGDNATGIGIEIHFFSNETGQVTGNNIASCNRYRLVQIRQTSARLFDGESAVQIDIPEQAPTPFYDSPPMEHGYGTHLTPLDDSDKPWIGRPVRASTVAIYDTPYVSDSYGIEGQHIRTRFETCVVCERDQSYDSVLSCGSWGFQRDYLNEETGWTEPDLLPMRCLGQPSPQFRQTLEQSNQVAYSFWLHWR